MYTPKRDLNLNTLHKNKHENSYRHKNKCLNYIKILEEII